MHTSEVNRQRQLILLCYYRNVHGGQDSNPGHWIWVNQKSVQFMSQFIISSLSSFCILISLSSRFWVVTSMFHTLSTGSSATRFLLGPAYGGSMPPFVFFFGHALLICPWALQKKHHPSFASCFLSSSNIGFIFATSTSIGTDSRLLSQYHCCGFLVAHWVIHHAQGPMNSISCFFTR